MIEKYIPDTAKSVIAYDRKPTTWSIVESEIAIKEQKKQKIDEINKRLLIASKNLHVDCRERFPEIPDVQHRRRKRDRESIKIAYDLLLQASQGTNMACNLINNDPQSLQNFVSKLGQYRRNVPRPIVEGLIGISRSIYPDIEPREVDEYTYTAFAGLGLLRVVLPEDYKTFEQREAALHYVLNEPITRQLYTDYPLYFDGSQFLRSDVNAMNLIQHYPEYYVEAV